MLMKMWRNWNSHIAGGNVKWCSCYGKTVRQFLKKLDVKLPFDPAIPFLGIYPKD